MKTIKEIEAAELATSARTWITHLQEAPGWSEVRLALRDVLAAPLGLVVAETDATSPVLPGDFMLPSDPAERIASVLGKPLVFEHRQLAPEPATATVASLIDADLGHAVNEMRAALGAFMHAQCNNDVAEITRLRLQYPFLGGDESTVTPESYVPGPAVPVERERPQWEYRSLATNGDVAVAYRVLNELGRDGWEAFATEFTEQTGRLWFLKRQVK